MKKIQSSTKLWMFFVIAILVPAVLLGYFAIRTVEQEEAVLERQWKQSLTIEVLYIGALVREQLVQMQRELDVVFTKSDGNVDELVADWKRQSDYIEVPYILSAERYFLWPHYSKSLSTDEWFFIKNHFDFFKDRLTTPVLDRSGIWKQSKFSSEELDLSLKSIETSEKKSQIFSEIIKHKRSGIIAQLIDNKLQLVYWKKLARGEVAGCLIDQDVMMKSLLEILPPMYSERRAINLLNERGLPLYGFRDSSPINWKKPFLTIRIGDQLPFWQVAAYLTDPNSIQRNAKSSALLIWMMISILILTILTAGSIIIKTLRNQIESAQQKTAFAANVSHELRTPLTSIKMFIEMLQRDDITTNKRHEYLSIMDRETDRLNHLIKNVLDFSRSKEMGKKYKFQIQCLDQILVAVLERYRVTLEKQGFHLEYLAADNNVRVNCDRNAIQQVISNLIDNAVKYSEAEKAISIHLSADNNVARILVEDSGVGVNDRDLKHIFKPYYRGDDQLTSKTQGTGLGLTIAHQIVSDHKGRIVYETKNRGSRFCIELPLVKG